MSNLLDQKLEQRWEELTDVPFDEDENGELVLAENWYMFIKGTDRETIWHWFDARHSKGVVWLMNNI